MGTRYLYSKREECCGCEACVSVCPRKIIKMEPDEYGFLYPYITDESACINCDQCSKVCPLKEIEKLDEKCFINYYAGYLKDTKELISCASGGIATAISKKMLNNGAIVYGVGYTDDWKSAEYKRVTNYDDLNFLKTSKYIQAEKGNLYNNILNDLKEGNTVLFIGLPCEVSAVKKRCASNEENLYTIELICHGPTSRDVQKQFIDARINKKVNKKIIDFSVRYKKNGKWKPFYIHIGYDDNTEWIQEFHDSAFGTAFKYMKRPSCYSCKIKGNILQADLMIGDYHYVEKGMKGYNSHGVSSALVHTEKGEELVKNIHDIFSVFPITEKAAMSNGSIISPIKRPSNADEYLKIYLEKGIFSAHKIFKIRIEHCYKKYKQRIKEKLVKLKRLLLPIS